MATIAVIDYGMGNLRSVSKALEYVSGSDWVEVTYDPDHIRRADRVVFPGVGAIRDCMSELQRLELLEVIREVAQAKPFLGICLGMQALLGHSEENRGVDAIGLVPGRVRYFGTALAEVSGRFKVPHMGWNRVHRDREHPLWRGIPNDSWFYFVHSYYAAPENPADVAGTSNYGIDFTAAVARENIFATQFHPEKSQHAGLDLLANFVRWDGTL